MSQQLQRDIKASQEAAAAAKAACQDLAAQTQELLAVQTQLTGRAAQRDALLAAGMGAGGARDAAILTAHRLRAAACWAASADVHYAVVACRHAGWHAPTWREVIRRGAAGWHSGLYAIDGHTFAQLTSGDSRRLQRQRQQLQRQQDCAAPPAAAAASGHRAGGGQAADAASGAGCADDGALRCAIAEAQEQAEWCAAGEAARSAAVQRRARYSHALDGLPGGGRLLRVVTWCPAGVAPGCRERLPRHGAPAGLRAARCTGQAAAGRSAS